MTLELRHFRAEKKLSLSNPGVSFMSREHALLRHFCMLLAVPLG